MVFQLSILLDLVHLLMFISTSKFNLYFLPTCEDDESFIYLFVVNNAAYSIHLLLIYSSLGTKF